MLLRLADARNKRVLPLTFLGGAAQDYSDARYWDLRDLILNDLAALADPSAISSIPSILETLLFGKPSNENRSFFMAALALDPMKRTTLRPYCGAATTRCTGTMKTSSLPPKLRRDHQKY